jgi:CHAD domain-containing protein
MAKTRADQNHVGPADVKELLRRCIGDASRRLRRRADISDEAIHSARKDLKRARANLRVLRCLIGDTAYKRENAGLRDAARPLSAVRDAKIVMDALDEQLERDDRPSERALLVNLRGQLEKARLAARREVKKSGVLTKSAESLEQAWARVDGWHFSRNGASKLGRALERVYRSGRKALADVKKESSPEKLHEWRKQVKYLTQAMDALKPPQARRLAKLIKRSDSVATSLGDDHDLVVLQEKIQALHSGSHNAHRALSAEIARRRKKLETKALRKGRALFEPRPKAFVKRLQKSL